MFRRRIAGLALLLSGGLGPALLPLVAADSAPGAKTPLDGNAVIRGRAGSSEIVITTTARLAGAVHSVQWGGREFIDSHDHGRQLQSACSFDCGSFKDFWAEAYNPTEAGSLDDGAGKTSSSKLRPCFKASMLAATSSGLPCTNNF